MVVVYEGSPRLGGKLRSEVVGGSPVDVGAESVLYRRPEAVTLFDELGVADQVVHPATVPASIVRDGARWPMPRATLMGVPSGTAGLAGLLRPDEVEGVERERDSTHPPVDGDVSVGDLVDTRLGSAVTDYLVEPLLAGVYAGHARAISAGAAVPAVLDAAQTGRSLVATAASLFSAPSTGGPVFATLRGGLGRLPENWRTSLEGKGVRVETSAMVRQLMATPRGWQVVVGPTPAFRTEVFDAVVLATPAAPAARLVAESAPESARELSGIEYASMAVVTYVLNGRPAALEGSSGLLVPPSEPFSIKASTFSTSKWPWLAEARPEQTLLRVSFGRHGDIEVLQQSDEQLAALGLSDLARLLGGALPAPVAWHVQRWGGGLPQYQVGHLQRVQRIVSGLPAGLAVCGAAYSGVGVPACIASGRAAARATLTHLSGGQGPAERMDG